MRSRSSSVGAPSDRARARVRRRSSRGLRGSCRRATRPRLRDGGGRPLRRGRHDARPPAREEVHDDASACAWPAGRGRTSPGSRRSSTTSTRSSPSDLRRGEAIALPIALLVLLAVFGVSLAVAIPFVFAACTITARSPSSTRSRTRFTMVALRDQPRRADRARRSRSTTRCSSSTASARSSGAGRASTTRSCGRWRPPAGRSSSPASRSRSGWRLLLFVPVPFIRSLGVGGLLVPLVIDRRGAHAPAGAPLAARAPRSGGRRAARRPDRATAASGRGSRASIMRRPVAVPRGRHGGAARRWRRRRFFLRLTPGLVLGHPERPESVAGLRAPPRPRRRRARSRRRRSSSTRRAGRRERAGDRRAVDRLDDRLVPRPRGATSSRAGREPPVRRPRAAATPRRSSSGGTSTAPDETPALRPAAPRDARSRAPASRRHARLCGRRAARRASTSSHRSYGAFPWLVAGGARAHLPRPAARVPLAAPAAEGRAPEPAHGRRGLRAARGRLPVGRRRECSASTERQIEGWIPIFLFAMLFGLSMDYEVFLVTRMRESWDDVARQRAGRRARARAHRARSSPPRR